MVELAILLPFLCFILVASTDFARAYHDLIVVTDGARNGALHACQHVGRAEGDYRDGIRAAALADATGLSPTPSVAITSGSLGLGNDYVDVTVSHTFKTLAAYPGIPRRMPLSRTVRMRVPPSAYRRK